MSDERPVVIKTSKKKVKTTSHGELSSLRCIVHYDDNVDDLVLKPLKEQTFERIKESKTIRHRQENPAWRLDDICCQIPGEFDVATHGCHGYCYRNFNNTSRFKDICIEVDLESTRSSSRVPSTSTSRLFPCDRCLFCDKKRKTVNRVEEVLEKCVTPTANKTIHDSCKRKGDHVLAGRIADCDLIAKEAFYHPSCRRNYTSNPDRIHHSVTHLREEGELVIGGTEHKRVTDAAFEHVCMYIRKHILTERNPEVVRMSMLRDCFLSHMVENAVAFYNPNYQMKKLKTRIVNRFAKKVKFYQPRQNASELVFKADIDVGAAVAMAYEAASSETKMYHDVAMSIRRLILTQQNKSPTMPWPPSADYLESDNISPPRRLIEFLQLIVTGKTSLTGENSSEKTERLSNAIVEDLCAAVNRGSWKMPKQLLLGLSVHHVTGSAKIVTMLNRFGHCCSYTEILDLETAMAAQAEDQDSVLPYNISTHGNIVSNLCWDNFDMDEETVSGSGTTHSTHGILIQELTTDSVVVVQETYLPRRMKGFKRKCESVLPPCYAKKRAEPALSAAATVPFDEVASLEAGTVESVGSSVDNSDNNSMSIDVATAEPGITSFSTSGDPYAAAVDVATSEPGTTSGSTRDRSLSLINTGSTERGIISKTRVVLVSMQSQPQYRLYGP